MKSKYMSYSVRVVTKENTTMEILKDDVNNSKYREVLQLYSNTKERFKDNSKRVEFYGVGENGDINLIYEKIYIKDFKRENVLEKLNNVVREVIETKNHLNDMKIVLEKEVDGLLHSAEWIRKLEEIQKLDGTYNEKEMINYKLGLLDDIGDTRIKRREVKKEIEILNHVKLPDLSVANGIFKKYKTPFNPSLAPDNINVYTTCYSSERERQYMMKYLTSKYTKVVDMKDGTIKYCNTINATSVRAKGLMLRNANKNGEKVYRANKLPNKAKGQTLKVMYFSEGEKNHILKTLVPSFKQFNINEQKKIIDLIERVS